MGDNTKIEWADATWNPIVAINNENGRRGNFCIHASPGCTHCYAARLNQGMFGNGLDYVAQNKGKVSFELATSGQRSIDWPLRVKEPKQIFVESMSDLFAKFIPDELIAAVLIVCALACHHTYLILTKRAARMRTFFDRYSLEDCMDLALDSNLPMPSIGAARQKMVIEAMRSIGRDPESFSDAFPCPHIFLGCSVEDQQRADERRESMQALAEQGWLTWVSYEPALSEVNWIPWLPFLRWIVAGGESGPGARAAHPAWFEKLKFQTANTNVAFFFKQWGEWRPCMDLTPEEAEKYPSIMFAPDGARCDSDDPAEVLAFCRAHKGAIPLYRLGHQRAGRLLDGQEWSQYPEVAHAS